MSPSPPDAHSVLSLCLLPFFPLAVRRRYGGLAWTNSLQWDGQNEFVNAQNTTWLYNGEEAGSSRTAQGFTFTRVKDAGHMVPLNQPQRALDLLNRVISGEPFDGQPSMSARKAKAKASKPALVDTTAAPLVADE